MWVVCLGEDYSVENATFISPAAWTHEGNSSIRTRAFFRPQRERLGNSHNILGISPGSRASSMLDLRIAQVVNHKLVEVSNGKRANSSRVQYDRGREAEENVKAVHCTWIEYLPIATGA
jgi:hypothetical protein